MDPRDARDVPAAPWDPWGTPLGPPATPLGAPGTPLGPQETPLGPPRGLQGPLMDHKNGHISVNIQRQKFSIAVFKPACWNPSP